MVVSPHQVEFDYCYNWSLPTAVVISVRSWLYSGGRPVTSLFLPLENTRLAASLGWMGRRSRMTYKNMETKQ
jgi:hypothetical protein